MYGRVGSGQPMAGMNMEMNVLIALVIGGVSFAGGEGKVGKVCCGMLLIGMLTNGLTLNKVTEYVQMVIRGLIFLGAVLLDAYQHMPKKKKTVVFAPKVPVTR
jgi:ribose/xylose/arabinose/galactoside ABC-type transport system permease subunit